MAFIQNGINSTSLNRTLFLPANTLSRHDRSTRILLPTRRPRCNHMTAPNALLPGADVMDVMTTLASVAPEWEPALQAGKIIAGPGINLFNFVMIVRIILSWYPQTDLAKVPWIFIAVPTEPLLRATRKVIKPVGGVDISPIVWFALMSFVHEILVGPQGIFVLLSQ